MVSTLKTSYSPQIRLFARFRDYTNRDTQCSCPYWAYKSYNSRESTHPPQSLSQTCGCIGLDVDLQATEKTRALLGKQRHKTTNRPAMDWKNVPDFYKTPCKKTTIVHLALHLPILIGVLTYFCVIFIKAD